MTIPVPFTRRADETRDTFDLPVNPPFVGLAEEVEVETAAAFESRIEAAIASNRLPPVFTNHPVYTQRLPGELVMPVIMYVDAVEFTRTDSVVGFFLQLHLHDETFGSFHTEVRDVPVRMQGMVHGVPYIDHVPVGDHGAGTWPLPRATP